MYTVIESVTYAQCGTQRTYGIATGNCRITDLSTDRDAMELLARRCNDGGLSPLHLKNIAEDWLALQ